MGPRVKPEDDGRESGGSAVERPVVGGPLIRPSATFSHEGRRDGGEIEGRGEMGPRVDPRIKSEDEDDD